MGGAQSTEQALPSRASRQVQARQPQSPPVEEINEKFEQFRLAQKSSQNRILSNDATNVVAAETHRYIKELLQDSKNQLGLAAISTHNMNEILEKPSVILKDTQIFNVAIPHEGSPVTNQRSSGRCWIFAATNVFRIAIQQKYNIDQFELSQAYLFFWDKIEKANYFLEQIIDLADKAVIDDRLVAELHKAPVNDGGQWQMVVNLVSKYGIIPQTLYPDTWNAMNSAAMDRLITTKLREASINIRAFKSMNKASKIPAYKESVMQDITRILTLCLGPPPAADAKFRWEFYDKSKKLRSVSISPLDFAASTEVTKFVSLVNDPRNEYFQLLTVSHLGNVFGGLPVEYVNVDHKTLSAACVAQLKRGLPVWFGSDVGKQSDTRKGIMDVDLVDYELGFNVQLGMSKAQRLMTGESAMTHAMVLTAVHLDKDGKPVRWRVENSWSETAGTDGYFVMSDRWMKEFFYQAVIDPALLSDEVKDVLKQEPRVLPLWDPLGALA